MILKTLNWSVELREAAELDDNYLWFHFWEQSTINILAGCPNVMAMEFRVMLRWGVAKTLQGPTWSDYHNCFMEE